MAFNKEKVMDAARKFVEKGQIDKAIKEYLRVVREDPQDVRVWLKIGDLYARKGGKQEATETYLRVARFYQDQGFFTKAVAVYKQILKLDNRLVEVHLKLAELYRQLGLMSDAMQHFEQVAAHFHREGKTKEALATVRQLVDLDPGNVATRIKLAELYSKEGMTDDAVAEFTAVCDHLRRQHRVDDFIKVAERLLWHRPEARELNRELAGLYLRKGDPRRALQKLQQCFKADPRDVETLALLAQAFQALDQRGKTVSVLKELARILEDGKERGKAEEVYRKILQFAPGDPDAVAFLGGGGGGGAAAPSGSGAAPAAVPAPTGPAALAARAKLNLTGDVPALRAPNDPRMTGAMPLIDERALDAHFELPEDEPLDTADEVEPDELVDDDDDGEGLGRAGRRAADFAADFAPDDGGGRAASAASEEHADEIAKLLTETDVYVKYGLHQKAVDHLRRVFALDPDNVEARERLKDVYLAQGRERDAIAELLRLAESAVGYDPERAEAYLREVLGIDGGHRGAHELIARYGFHLDVAPRRAASEFSLDPRELAHGAIAPVDDEFALEAYDYGPTTRAPARADSFDGIDPSVFDRAPSTQSHGRAGTARPRGGEVEGFAPSAADSTRQVAASEVAGLVARTRGEVGADVAMGSPPPFRAPATVPVADTWKGERTGLDPVIMRAAIDAELDDELGDDIDQQVAAELRGQEVARYEAPTGEGDAYDVAPDDELPFDPEAARAFDAVMRRTGRQDPLATDPLAGEELATYDPGVDAGPTPFLPGESATRLGPPPEDDGFVSRYTGTTEGEGYPAYGGPVATAARTIDEPVVDFDPTGPLEDLLEQADDLAAQGAYPEAAVILRALATRHPGHPLVTARARDLEAALHGDPSGDPGGDPAGGTQNVDMSELEELAVDAFDEPEPDDDVAAAFDEAQRVLAARHDPSLAKVRPAVVLERPVEDSDADTHFDLGLAYKEMGLYDEAIKAFDKVTSSPHREVQSRMMIGLCHREQHNLSEAVHQFKAGLHASAINDRERQGLLYEIGTTYEALGDPREAIYYFEMVLKRDPNFLDAAERMRRLQGGAASRPGSAASAAIDSLLDDE
jgi:pilus assembly protein FimV